MKDSLLIQPAKPAVSNNNTIEAQRAKSAGMRRAEQRSDAKENTDYGSRKENDFSKQFEKSHAQAQKTSNPQHTSNQSEPSETSIDIKDKNLETTGKEAGTLAGEILNADLTLQNDTPKTPPSDTFGLNTIKGSNDTAINAPSTEAPSSLENTVEYETAVIEISPGSEMRTSLYSEASLFNYNAQTLTADEAAQIAVIETPQTVSALADRVTFGATASAHSTDDSTTPTAAPDIDIIADEVAETSGFLSTIKGHASDQEFGGTPSNLSSETRSNSDDTLTTETLEELTAELDSLDLDAFDIDDIEIDMGELQFQRQNLNTGPLMQTAFESLTTNTFNMGLSVNGEAGTLRPMTTITMPPSAPGSATVNATAIVNTVAQAILTAKETPQGVMVRLDPPEMGRVLIDFNFENDSQVNVVVKADSADSHQLLRDRSEHFLQMLEDSGFENVNLSFEQQSSGDLEQNPDNDNRPQSVVYYDAPIIEKIDPENQAAIRRQISQGELRLDLKL